jgi:hypothetical protein
MGDGPKIAAELAAMAAEKVHDPRQVQIKESVDGEYVDLELTTGDPQNPGLLGASIAPVNGEPKAMIKGIWAGTKRQGEATGLMQALVVDLKHRGINELWSYTVSAEALKFRASFFGPEALHFYDFLHPEKGFLPLTVDEAIATAERVDELKGQNKLQETASNFGLCVDLDQVDASSWTEPTPSAAPMVDLVGGASVPTNLELKRREDDDNQFELAA